MWVDVRKEVGWLVCRTWSSVGSSIFLIVPGTPAPLHHTEHHTEHHRSSLGLGPERLSNCAELSLVVSLALEHKLIIFYCFSVFWGLKAGLTLRAATSCPCQAESQFGVYSHSSQHRGVYAGSVEGPGPKYRKKIPLKSQSALMLTKSWVCTARVEDESASVLRVPPCWKPTQDRPSGPWVLPVWPCEQGREAPSRPFGKDIGGTRTTSNQVGHFSETGCQWMTPFISPCSVREHQRLQKGQEQARGIWLHSSLFSTQYTDSKTIHILKEKIFPKCRGMLKSVSVNYSK